jgi:hypothetical protein
LSTHNFICRKVKPMKFQTCLLLAACCCLLAVISGLVPVQTQGLAADPILVLDTISHQPIESPELPMTYAAAEPEPPAQAFDTTPPNLEPELAEAAEPEAPDTRSAANKSCPANSSASSSGCARGGGRDFRLFDGDGYLIDRRGETAACGDGEAIGPARRILRRVLGVERRQNRRAAGRGLFGCGC